MSRAHGIPVYNRSVPGVLTWEQRVRQFADLAVRQDKLNKQKNKLLKSAASKGIGLDPLEVTLDDPVYEAKS